MRTFRVVRLSLAAAAFLATAPLAFAQNQSTADPDRPVTPPDSYRVVMENERVRIIEIHIKAHSKVNVDSPANRDRFLYMLSDGALVLAPPGKKPYEFALHAGETAVFPAVSPTVENDTDSPVRALMVEVKMPVRSAAASGKPGKSARHGTRTKEAKAGAKSKKSAKSKSTRSASEKSKTKHAKKPRKPETAAATAGAKPLNLQKANAKPAKRVSRKGKGSDG
jgi:hypothetical protein